MLREELSWVRIAGVALVLFSGVLLGVGIHHLVATGTCSSTGYSANYGPVPHCPSGIGWWFAFVFVGIIGCLVGSMMASATGLIFASIFGAIGFGALSLVLDASARSGTKVFAAVFGGAFALVGIAAAVMVVASAISSLRATRGPKQVHYGKTKTTTRPAPAPQPSATPSQPLAQTSMGVPTLTPLNLVPGLQVARSAATGDAVDELSKLSALHQQGSLTDEEFASAKSKLLGQL
jgi:hypothetical protein